MPVGDKQKLITEIVSRVLNEPAQINKRLEWFINKHTEKNFGNNYASICRIFTTLNGDFTKNQSKRSMLLNCDAYFGGEYNFIFEFDEFQHFNSSRQKTFEHYPENIKLNFDVNEWKKLCTNHKEKADKYRKNKTTIDFNFLGGRTAQRAYLDCFRDLLPEIQGLNPTLRINEFEVSGIYYNDKEACKRIEKLLKTKLS
ncbi:MAG TPA: hypothetical protein VFM65_05220 [Flavobacteriaceae bacterium]|nr:hypothetical protein [Flavobacteriaceae bacterium]